MLIVIALLSTSSLHSFAEEKKGETYADVGLFSHYVWRGQKLSDGLVIQPSVGLVYEGIGINFWSNFDRKTKQHNETDITVNYTFSSDTFEFDVGYIYYAVEVADDQTGELFLSTTYDALLSPSATLYYDTDKGDGGFVEFTVDHTLDLSDAMQLNIGALVGYNLSNSVMEEEDKAFNGFYNGELSVSLPYSISKELSVEALLAYSFPLRDVEFIKIPLLLVFLPALSRQVFVA
ncbi:hypothetical protein MNBD_GAMMA18-1202 [hydrothermal vent metagenome]|uniref:Uncharacterized protein n=1 Tax=hydrothermal vent metagenome TaxID=652676 RepID=A0A3B0Z2M1_9ZZZZ